MDVAAYFVGLACGLVFLLPTVRRMRTARAAMEAARALERSTQVELCVVRERNASEVAGLRRSHDDELNALRGRFGLEVRMLREAVSSARQELDRNQGIERPGHPGRRDRRARRARAAPHRPPPARQAPLSRPSRRHGSQAPALLAVGPALVLSPAPLFAALALPALLHGPLARRRPRGALLARFLLTCRPAARRG